ncbi:hypothetical protein [Sulfurimonas sp.]
MRIIIALLLTISLYADLKQEMFGLYQNQKFEKVCTMGFDNFTRYKRDEEFVSLYAFACLNSDFIDRLAIPIAVLKFSKESRANSAYFSVILMQKKLLYHSLVDGYELTSFKLPTTDYVLSKVFNLYSKLKDKTKRTFYLFEDPKDSKVTYKLYLEKDYKIRKMVIEEYYDTILIKRHVYW